MATKMKGFTQRRYQDQEKVDHRQKTVELIQERIKESIEDVEKGLKWVKPFITCNRLPVNLVTGSRYSGGNILMLLSTEMSDHRYATFKQIADLAGSTGQEIHVRKGEKACAYVRKVVPIYEKDETGAAKKDDKGEYVVARDEDGQKRQTTKYYPVFNASQIEGIEPYRKANNGFAPHEEVEMLLQAFKEKTGLTVEESGRSAAYFSPSENKIHMPFRHLFKDDVAYYSTLLHEMGHATGPILGRDMKGTYGSADYAREEFHAEIICAFISGELGVPRSQETLDQHASYLKSWGKLIEDDKDFIFKAAENSSKAADYLNGILEAYKQERGLSKSTVIETPVLDIPKPAIEKQQEEKKAIILSM